MLYLKRKAGTTIHINGPCVVHISKIGKSVALVGVEADPSVKIYRGEILDGNNSKLAKEKNKASK